MRMTNHLCSHRRAAAVNADIAAKRKALLEVRWPDSERMSAFFPEHIFGDDESNINQVAEHPYVEKHIAAFLPSRDIPSSFLSLRDIWRLTNHSLKRIRTPVWSATPSPAPKMSGMPLFRARQVDRTSFCRSNVKPARRTSMRGNQRRTKWTRRRATTPRAIRRSTRTKSTKSRPLTSD